MCVRNNLGLSDLMGKVVFLTQKSITGLSSADLTKVNKLIFSHYPFTSDLETVCDITYRLTDGYYTVRYPSCAKELQTFNMSFTLYSQILGNFIFTKGMPGDCNLAPVTSQVDDETRHLTYPTYEDLQRLMDHGSLYNVTDRRYAGVLRSPDPDDLTKCNYYLLPVMYGSILLDCTVLEEPYTVIRSKCFDANPSICISILEMYRLAQLLRLEHDTDYQHVLDEWYEVPRYAGYDRAMIWPVKENLWVKAPYDPRECAMLATHPERRLATVLLERGPEGFRAADLIPEPVTETKMAAGNLETLPSVFLAPCKDMSFSCIRNRRDEAILTQLNVIRSHIGLPALKGEWGTEGYLLGFQEEK